MKRSKGFFAQLLVALLLSITFIGLGNWQLNRAQDVKAVNKTLPDAARTNLEDIASADSNLEPESINRLVSVSGKYVKTFTAPEQKLLGKKNSSTADLEVRILELSGKRGILIVRGVASLENQELIGVLKINGRLYPRQTSDTAKAAADEISRIDPALVVAETDLALFDGYIIATSESTNLGEEILTTRIAAPQLKSVVAGNYWQHVSYVFVWWLMALLVLLAPFYNSMKERQSGAKVAI